MVRVWEEVEMSPGIQLRKTAAYDEASLDLAPYVSQVQSNLTRVARAIVQLDERVTRLEEQHPILSGSQEREHGGRPDPAAALGLTIALLAGSSLIAVLLGGLLGMI